jgi:cyclic pyranopterin phosphate synthase
MSLSHINKEGRAQMVDVTKKQDTYRVAEAVGSIRMNKETLERIIDGGMKKGDVLAVSQVAGIMAAKQTSSLIPMCHPLLLTSVDISFTHDLETNELFAKSRVALTGKTGVEMEALTAVSVALLTVYDMCKAIDKGMVIKEVKLLSKIGGKSGEYRRNENE